ncbi:diguanylate cyclase domain-containing protein [Capilliphycus salinus ALCB114379]|uniref:diguanylate cyclase domain-containing protein n=1 Tax=Capilliphycus salinus TaxID=2768948 RepID=UPI0039A6FC18
MNFSILLVAAIWVGGVGLLVLVSLVFNFPLLLREFLEASFSLKPSIAFSFLLFGFVLQFLLIKPPRLLFKRVAQVGTVAILGLNGLTVLYSAINWNFIFEHGLSPQPNFLLSLPVFSVGCQRSTWELIGLAIGVLLLIHHTPKRVQIAQALTGIVLAIETTNAIAFLFSLPFSDWGVFFSNNGIPLETISFIFLGFGILWLYPHRGLMRTFTHRSVLGIRPYKLLGAIILLVFIKKILLGLQPSLPYNALFLDALETVFEFSGFLGFVGWMNNRSYAIYLRRQRSELYLKHHHQSLENQVAECTAKLSLTQTQFNAILNSVAASIGCFRFYENGTWEREYHLTGCEALFGYTPEELTPSVWESRIPPEDLQAIYQQAFEAVSAEKSVTLEYRFYHKDGSLKWICDTLTSQRDEQGDFWRVFAVGFDISDRKQAEAELQQREEDFRALVENSPDIIARFDRQFRFSYVNPKVEVETGIPTSDWIGKTEIELGFSEKIYQPLHRTLQQVFETGEEQLYEAEFPSADGTLKYWQCRVVPEFNEEGIVVSALKVSRDITEQKLVENALRQCAEHEKLLGEITDRIRQSLELDQILATAVAEVQQILQADRVFIYRFNSDWSGTIVTESVVAGFESILGKSCKDSYLVETRGEVFRQGKIQVVDDIYTANLTPCHRGLLLQLEIRASLLLPICIFSPNSQREKDSQIVWGLLGVNSCLEPRKWETHDIEFLKRLTGKLAIAVQQSALYEQLQIANEELQYLAHYDQLTEVANRRYFDEYLEKEWDRLKREQAPLSLILCDVDYFKRYNDTYGHLAGDRCLTQVAQAISRGVKRPADLVARYGGEEFVVILPNTNAEGAVEVVRQIQQEIQQLNLPHSTSLAAKQVTLTFGIAWVYPSSASSTQTLIDRADQALYQAKDAGRNSYSLIEL